MVYFDNAASAPLFPEVISEMHDIMLRYHGNPSAIHSYGREARVIIEEARKTIAQLLQASPAEIVFTSGGTEANNWGIASCVKIYGVKHIITTQAEHPAVLKPISNICQSKEIQLSYLPLDNCGHFDLNYLDDLLQKSPKALVCLMHANNEVGTLLPLKNIAEICQKNKAYFFSDMVQTIGKYPFSFSNVKVGFASASAHKFHGPKGIGFLYINNDNPLDANILGGGQERERRAGTENIYGIVGMAKALVVAHQNMLQSITHITELKEYLKKALSSFDGVSFNGNCDKGGLYTILNVAFPNTVKTAMLVNNLDIAGIAVSGGSACASGSIKPSHVLKAINADTNKISIRFSFSCFNTKKEIDTLVETLNALL